MGFCLCLLIDRKEKNPIDTMKGGEKKAFRQLSNSIVGVVKVRRDRHRGVGAGVSSEEEGKIQ